MIKKDLPIADIDGESLKNARIQSGTSKADLAKKLCLSVAHINELETGELKIFFNHRHRYFTALKLGKLLGLSEADIIKSRFSLDKVIPGAVNMISPADVAVVNVDQSGAKKTPKPRFRLSGKYGLAKTMSSPLGFAFMRRQKLLIILACAAVGFLGTPFFFDWDGSAIFTSKNSAKINQELPQAPTDYSLVENLKSDEPVPLQLPPPLRLVQMKR